VWLRRFHLLPAPPGSSYDADQLVTYCDHRLRLISDGHAFGLDRPFLASISARVRALIRAIPPGDLQVVGCHYDFRPGNIVTDGRCLVVLDFGGYAPGPRLYDVLKFLTRVDSLASANPGARPFVRGLKDAFTGGYGQPVDFGAPLARLLLTANLLDQLSDLAEARPRTPIRRLQFRWWSHDLVRRLRQVIA
jgi:Ser/Thr protein kinase RdoA (MazF antagonist)